MIRLFAGEFGETLLNSHRAVPDRLLEAGYEFRYPRLAPALGQIAG
jgi:NAD dependent epimerase/dehydratase family enzyme